jgi:hypothetical protein
MTTKVHVYAENTRLRTGGSKRGPDNVIKKIQPGEYEALYQCTGQDITENGHSNYWWVKIKAGSDEGWVSAVLITQGGENQPIPGVDERATVFV